MVFDPKTEFNNLGQRLGELAGRFEKTARKRGADKAAAKGVKVVETVVNNIHDMFTHGVTKEGLSDLIHREARDTLRFYTREIDFESLRSLPRFKRYPLTAWKIFVATAYRLSPPRRIAFALAIFAFSVGALHWLTILSQRQEAFSAFFWWFIAFAVVLLLLLMELRDKLDLKGDLEIAREIQITLVPSGPFARDSVRIFSHMRPANTVGGDYHDIIELGNNRLGILIGDVAGKGIPAALLMALLQGSLRTLLTAGFRGPELIQKLNGYLCENIPNDRLVTLFYAELDTVTGAITYVNAGHNAPFLLRCGQAARRLDTTSMVLGVLEDTSFEARETQLESGDRLVLFTDGISEAFNQNEQEYGEERLESFLQNQTDMNEEGLVFGLITEVLAFCEPSRPSDDMTLMCISRL